MTNLSLNTAVFTTKFIVLKYSEITYVTHDDDGSWQFLSQDIAIESDAMVLSLEEIIAIDPSVQELFTMGEGFEAYRDAKGDQWVICKQK